MTPTRDGIVLGQWRGKLLRHTGPEHVMLVAPPRSGKGVNTVIPTLLTRGRSSTVVMDIKGENWQATAGYLARQSHVLYFNPTSLKSIRINPLLEVREGLHEVQDMQNLADIITDPEGTQDRRDYWSRSGHAILVGGGLHVLYAEPDKTLAGLANFFSDPQRDFTDTLLHMMRTKHLGDRVHPVVASAARECLNKSPNELSGVLSTAMSFLGLYRDPIVARATSASDIRLRDLQHARHPVTLYLVIPPSDLSRVKPLLRLLLNQIGRTLTDDWTVPPRYPLDLILDEFPALGGLDFFESALAYLAGYQIRAVLVAQSLHQLDKAYGQHNAIMDTCHTRLFFAPNESATAQRISDMLSTATTQRHQRSRSGSRFAFWYRQESLSEVVAARPLQTRGEVLQLPRTHGYLFREGERPMLIEKLRYYDDRRFQARLLPPPSLDRRDLPPTLPSPWEFHGPKPLALPIPQRHLRRMLREGAAA